MKFENFYRKKLCFTWNIENLQKKYSSNLQKIFALDHNCLSKRRFLKGDHRPI